MTPLSDVSELIHAYENASYEVEWQGKVISFSIANPCADLSNLLAANQSQHAILITAHNPHSRLLSPAESNHRNQLLKAQIETSGYVYFMGRGYCKANTWPPEESFLVLNIAKNTAHHWLKTHEQLACVWVDSSGTATLLLNH